MFKANIADNSRTMLGNNNTNIAET